MNDSTKLKAGTRIRLVKRIKDCDLPEGADGAIFGDVEGVTMVEFDHPFEDGTARRFNVPFDSGSMMVIDEQEERDRLDQEAQAMVMLADDAFSGEPLEVEAETERVDAYEPVNWRVNDRVAALVSIFEYDYEADETVEITAGMMGFIDRVDRSLIIIDWDCGAWSALRGDNPDAAVMRLDFAPDRPTPPEAAAERWEVQTLAQDLYGGTADEDDELADALNDGWEIVDLTVQIVAPEQRGDGFHAYEAHPMRIITLKRRVTVEETVLDDEAKLQEAVDQPAMADALDDGADVDVETAEKVIDMRRDYTHVGGLIEIRAS